MTATRQKELRLALVCYGGVSLAVYMHGVTKELWKLLRASEARGREALAEGDTEQLWGGLLEDIGCSVDLTVVSDIIAGASAGGINGILLAHAVASGASLEPLTPMWLEEADVERLLDPEAVPARPVAGRFAAFYKEPVAWFASRQSQTLAAVDDPAVRAEIAMKLARFVRARWFNPPFSGPGLVAMLDRAMERMEEERDGRALVPPSMAVDLFVTATDYHGRLSELPIHSPPYVLEKEHRRLFGFHAPAVMAPRSADGDSRGPIPVRRIGDRPALLFAARATACFPGAFPPAHIGEIDARLAETGKAWPGREGWLAGALPGDRAPEDVRLIDGSVLNNAPFGPALRAVRTRPAHREVDRRFVYIDPKPGIPNAADALENRPPGFFTTILRALADIPREQPIRDNLEAIAGLSARVRRLRSVIEGMTPVVDGAIERAVGPGFFMLPLTPQRVARARHRTQSLAAKEAGYAFAGYAQLKLRGVLEEAAGLLARAGGVTDGPGRARVEQALEAEARRRGGFDQQGAVARTSEASGYVRLLRGMDVGFRVRRLRFVVRRLAADVVAVADPEERAAISAVKARLIAAMAPYLAIRAEGLPDQPMLAVRTWELLATAPGSQEEGEAAAMALDRLAAAMDLRGTDGAVDAVLLEAGQDPAIDRGRRRAMMRSFLGFPFYDIAILPIMQDEASDSFDEIRVDRISPDDAPALRAGGTRACLKGWQLNAFGGFFSRAWRENDYLWGRLHAAERLVDIVLSSVAESGCAAVDAGAWKARLFRAILQSERGRLQAVGPLIDELEQVMAEWENGA